jgi:clan AA aspartic protease
MIHGQVSPYREAVIELMLAGPTGLEMQVDAVLDTGFTECLTLSPTLIAALQLVYVAESELTLADGSDARFDVFRVLVLWHGNRIDIPVLSADGDPLVGMSLLYGSRVTLDIVDGGPVAIEPLP